MENLLEWFLTIFICGLVAFFLTAGLLEASTMLGISNPYMTFITILITDVTAFAIVFGASARLIKRARQRSA